MQQIPFVDFKKQYQTLKQEIEKEVLAVLGSFRYVSGEKVGNFEKNFAEFCQTKYALAVNNGTSALILALMALGLKPGDEVITQPNTFVATIEAIVLVGAKPVFVDIDPKTYNLDVSKIEKAISKKTKAILPVHLFGQISDMGPILKIAKKHNLFIVEDCAQAHGAEYKGKRAGSLGDIGCFSFYPTKVLGAMGEGGAVTTNKKSLAEKMKRIRDHGSQVKYVHQDFGLNLRMEEIQGAVLGVKLKYLDQWIKNRREAAKIYNSLLESLSLVVPFEPDFAKSVYYVYVVRVKNRVKLQDYLKKEGIGTMVHYPIPVHLQPAYRYLAKSKGSFPEAEKAAKEILSLPFFPEIEVEEQKHVVKKIEDFQSLR